MTPSEYLDAAKKTLGIESDYELSNRLEVSRQEISNIRSGHMAMGNMIAVKVAITLQVDPSQVIADLECQREKNAKKREFWKGFISRAAIITALVCTLVSSSFVTYESGAALAGGAAVSIVVIFWLRKLRIICPYDKFSLSHHKNR